MGAGTEAAARQFPTPKPHQTAAYTAAGRPHLEQEARLRSGRSPESQIQACFRICLTSRWIGKALESDILVGALEGIDNLGV